MEVAGGPQRLVVGAWEHGDLAAAVNTLADFLPEDDLCRACRVSGHDQCGAMPAVRAAATRAAGVMAP
jgi:hypothetical protein